MTAVLGKEPSSFVDLFQAGLSAYSRLPSIRARRSIQRDRHRNPARSKTGIIDET